MNAGWNSIGPRVAIAFLMSAPNSLGDDGGTISLNSPPPLAGEFCDNASAYTFFLGRRTIRGGCWCRCLLDFYKADKIRRVIPAQIVEGATRWAETRLRPRGYGVSAARS